MDEEQQLTEIKQSLESIGESYMEMPLAELKRSYRYVGRASNFVWGLFEAGTPDEKDILRPIYRTIIELTISMSSRRDELQAKG